MCASSTTNRLLEEDDINDGSGSDDGREGYVLRHATAGLKRIHHIPDERITKSASALKPDIAPPPPPESAPEHSHSEDWQADFAEFDAEYGEGIQSGPRDQRTSDDPGEQWARLDRPIFLDEILRLDGRGEHGYQQESCAEGCGAKEPNFRCIECMDPSLYCEGMHGEDALAHAVPSPRGKWDGRHFTPKDLKSLKLRIQLGHCLNEPCNNPEPSHGDDFVIVGSHRIHEVHLDDCNCSKSEEKQIQLLRARLYPATGMNPRSAATFGALERFDLLSMESKCSAYQFYNSLARETDNTGSEPSRVWERYEEFLRMTRQWQNLHLLKRAGRRHDPAEDRIAATKPGECALLCPACPQPGKNLPPGWEKVPFVHVYLYALFVGLDANFRLKRRDVSSEEKDPGLGTGWAFFGDVKKYMAHLDKHWDFKQERSTCVAHDAVDKPDRESLGTASSGICTVDCARHNMKRPLGVGDLQKGERYINMDYMFFMSIAGSPLLRLFVSYDIACQWHKNIWDRMKLFELNVQFKEDENSISPAHIELCNILFSFNLTPFMGRTDGEAPERGWADANRLANSTSVSGPGARRDQLDHHFQDSNWKKIVHLGRDLLEKIRKYVLLMLETRQAWVDMEASFPPAAISTWTEMAVAWEADSSQPNPFQFQSTVEHEGLREVRRRLAEIAAEDIELLNVRGDMHETEMLSMGLQLEESQRLYATHLKNVGAHETVDQGRRRIERETKLHRKIDTWMAVQQLFIPEVTLLRERDDAARKRVAATQALPGLRAQDIKLYLPSGIGRRVHCDESLQVYEYDLRKGQAFGALKEMCDQLLVRTYEYQYRDKSLHGVKAKTRSGTRTEGIQARIDRAADEYWAAYRALESLGPVLRRTEWKTHLRPLAEADVRGRPSALFGDEERQKGGRKKRKRARLDPEEEARRAALQAEDKLPLSWIWVSHSTTGTEEDVVDNEALRIEWAKTHARAMRYAEEVELVEEEMRRVVQFLRWRAGWWRSLVGLCASMQLDAALREGHAAYAHKQAECMDKIADRFAEHWKDVPAFLQTAREHYASIWPDDEDDDGADEEDSDNEGVGTG
ncbi:hypothetical protein MVEN_01436100 [Mycena venus]|uniref:CxC2-like cysteine cluster KDZ transposase-associated domain-containing protein n=1 Tax=Mycena venus TaxID=2733690 RepID=A0A8H6XYL4_9AGAR|nr:hypothetical protein MVEN_01436100 [Mycena venus]